MSTLRFAREMCAREACSRAESSVVVVMQGAGGRARAEQRVPDGRGRENGVAASAAQYNPDAAIVNYYREGDTLNGHQDDVEEDVAQPIVSVSVGCDAVFLIGGHTKAERPTALLLSSGDVMVMRADARLSFHGACAARARTYPGLGFSGDACRNLAPWAWRVYASQGCIPAAGWAALVVIPT